MIGTIGFKKLYKKLNEAHWHGEDYSGRTGYYEPEGNDRTHGPGGPVLYPFYILGHVANSMNVYVIWRDLTGFWHSSSLIFSGSFLHYPCHPPITTR